jgi:ABC-type phosphate transport system substrate-binding protein
VFFPIFQHCIADCEATQPGTVRTVNATRSSAGLNEAIAGCAQIGASDAYMLDDVVGA